MTWAAVIHLSSLKSRIDDEVLIFHDAVGRDFKGRIVHGDDLVGFSRQLPAGGGLERFGQVRRIAEGHPAQDPLAEGLFIGVGHVPGVGKMSVLGIGVPRRHPAVVDDFQHRLAPACDFIILGQRKRPDLSRAMAFHAVLVEDAGNLFDSR